MIVKENKLIKIKMKDIITFIRVMIVFIGLLLMTNEQQYPKEQNWWINLLGLGLIIIVSINFNFYKKIK